MNRERTAGQASVDNKRDEGEEKRGRLTKLDVGTKRDVLAEKKETNVGEP